MKYQSLIVPIGLFIASIANAQLIIVSTGNFNTTSAWSIDIDGDGVADAKASTTSNNVIWVRDATLDNSTFVSAGTSNVGVIVSFSGISLLNGTFTAASPVSIATNNASIDTALTDKLVLAHGTQTFNLSSAISLVGFAVESPTSGSTLGSLSGINHNNDYYIYYNDFGDVAAGASVVIDFSTDILSVAAVPEPAAYAAILGVLALAGVMIMRHRRLV